MKPADLAATTPRLADFVRRPGLGGALLALCACLSSSAAEPDPFVRATLDTLRARQTTQEAKARVMKARRDFHFTHGEKASGINFTHLIVDDAGRDYKAIHYDHGNGVAAGDVDGDGRLDLYFTSQLGANHLYRNLGEGRFENITRRAGVELGAAISVGAAFADVDNDGDPDLFVTTVKFGNHLFENLGEGRFRDITRQAGVEYSGHSSGILFFDYDLDGWLDLFVVNVGVYTTGQTGRGGYYVGLAQGFTGHLDPALSELSILYRNQGDGTFRDVTAETGLRDVSWSGDATFADLNEDRYPDVYLLNMQGDDHYYENDQGRRFVDATARHFPKTPWGAMGVKFFDFNQDERLDLCLTDMHSDMTPRQNKETALDRTDLETRKSEAYCMAEFTDAFLQGASNNIFGNAFYINRGAGRFEEASDRLGLETYWPWGVSVGDLNADGFEDIFVAAGMGFPFRYGINSLLLNEGGQRFFDAEFLLGVEPRPDGRLTRIWFTLDCDGADKGRPECQGKSGRVSIAGTLSTRSAVILDLDDDGDLDIVTNEFFDHPQVLLSDLSGKEGLHFIKIRLVGRRSNRDGLGAQVRVKAGGKTFFQQHDGKSGYLAQSAMPLYFGLGQADRVESVEVRWPSGRRQAITEDRGINTLWTLTEPEDQP